VVRPVPAPHAGTLVACDVRALGLVVVALGGGRQRPGEAIDPRVGLSQLLPLGTRVHAGDALGRVHAADEAAAALAVAAVQAAFSVDDAPWQAAPVVRATVTG
jgi:thymidine phosphorylase